MKKLITLLLLLFVASQYIVQAQTYKPFIKMNAHWDEYDWSPDGSLCSPPFNIGFRYFFNGDSIINGLQYFSLRRCSIFSDLNPPNPPFFCPPYYTNVSLNDHIAWIREDTLSRKVFSIPDFSGEEQLEFDYSLQTGDTLQSSFSFSIIDSIGTVIFSNGEERKIFYMNYIGSIPGPGSTQVVIEGIGSIFGTFVLGGIYSSIKAHGLCYEEDGVIYEAQVLFSGIGDYCATAVSTSEPTINPYPISPNPTDDLLSVQIPEEIQPTQLIVTDISGRVVHQYSDWQSGTPLQVGMLPSGMYFLVAEDKAIGWRGVWKFVRR